MIESLENLKNSLNEKDSAAKARMENLATENATKIIQANIDARVLVYELEALNSEKILKAALNKVKSFSPSTSTAFFSIDLETGTMMACCSVPKVSMMHKCLEKIFQLFANRNLRFTECN